MKKYILWLVFVLLLGGFVLDREIGKKQKLVETQEPVVALPQEPPASPETPEPLEQSSLSVAPASPLPGEPAKVTIHHLDAASQVDSLTFNQKPLGIFAEEGRVAALIGIDFHTKPGAYPLVLTLENGERIESTVEVSKRDFIAAEFDIPEHLGGNTSQAQQNLTSTLSSDAAILNSVTTKVTPAKLWDGQFRFPLEGNPVITDVYGYSRRTGSVSLSHLGTDFRAAEGTPVYAANAGQVAYTGTLRNFGKTVVIDHGLGLMTLYMHLSQINTAQGAKVEKGDLIAKSGSTGYALGPHLHLSVRINGLSIDPQKFLELMGPQ